MAAFSAAVAAFALTLALPAQSRAADCGPELQGGGGSVWTFSNGASGWNTAFLVQGLGEPVRYGSFDGYTRIAIDGVDYISPDGNGCTFTSNGLDVTFPAKEVNSGIAVRPQDHLDPKRPAARELIRLTNTTGANVTFDFDWHGLLEARRGEIRLDRTSSGDAKATKRDAWATTCDDVGKPGCLKQLPVRGPELAHVWEGLDGKRDGLDAIELENGQDDYKLAFNNITLGPGRSTYMMRWVVLSASAKRARKVAAQLAGEPAWAFAGITTSQRKQIRNW